MCKKLVGVDDYLPLCGSQRPNSNRHLSKHLLYQAVSTPPVAALRVSGLKAVLGHHLSSCLSPNFRHTTSTSRVPCIYRAL